MDKENTKEVNPAVAYFLIILAFAVAAFWIHDQFVKLDKDIEAISSTQAVIRPPQIGTGISTTSPLTK